MSNQYRFGQYPNTVKRTKTNALDISKPSWKKNLRAGIEHNNLLPIRLP
jgi:hypothetical protein